MKVCSSSMDSHGPERMNCETETLDTAMSYVYLKFNLDPFPYYY